MHAGKGPPPPGIERQVQNCYNITSVAVPLSYEDWSVTDQEVKLTDKQQLFCREYMKDLNGAQAAIRAGYSVTTAKQIATENLSKPYLQSRIADLMAERTESVKIDAKYVLNRLVQIDKMDVADILNDDLSLKPLRDWPKSWRTTLSGLDIQSLASAEGDVSIIKKIKWPDKVKNLELLGRHIDVKAFEKELAPVTGIIHVMPVPTASSVEDWEAAAAIVQQKNSQ